MKHYAREKGRKPKRNQIFTRSKGQHLTHPESIAAICADYDTRAEAKEQKWQGSTIKKGKKLDWAKMDLEWKAIKELHLAKVEKWEAECARLTVEGVLKKNLPKKLLCPLKPKLPKGLQAQSNDVGWPDRVEESNSSSSSEEEDNEWLAWEAPVTACHTVSRSRDHRQFRPSFYFMSPLSISSFFLHKKNIFGSVIYIILCLVAQFKKIRGVVGFEKELNFGVSRSRGTLYSLISSSAVPLVLCDSRALLDMLQQRVDKPHLLRFSNYPPSDPSHCI